MTDYKNCRPSDRPKGSVVLALVVMVAIIAMLGHIDNQKMEIIKIKQEISKCRN